MSDEEKCEDCGGPCGELALRIGRVLKEVGPPNEDMGHALMSYAVACLMGDGYTAEDFVELARAAAEGAMKAERKMDPQRRMRFEFARLMRSTPCPGSDDAVAQGCVCPSPEKVMEKIPAVPGAAHVALDPMCKVHGEMAMKMAQAAGVAASA